MKHNLHFIVLLLMFLIFSSQISASFIATEKGQEETKLKELTGEGPLQQMEDGESMNELMGMEVCENRDEDCLKRRIVSEAHLDYIYTQHHKP